MEASYSEARANLATLWDEVVERREVLTLHRRGREDVALLPAAELTSLLETAHLLRSPRNARRLLEALRESLADEEAAPTEVAALRRELGLERKHGGDAD